MEVTSDEFPTYPIGWFYLLQNESSKMWVVFEPLVMLLLHKPLIPATPTDWRASSEHYRTPYTNHITLQIQKRSRELICFIPTVHETWPLIWKRYTDISTGRGKVRASKETNISIRTQTPFTYQNIIFIMHASTSERIPHIPRGYKNCRLHILENSEKRPHHEGSQ